MSDRKLFIELAEALQDRQDNQIDILKLHSEQLDALHGVLAALADVVKDIREHMLTRDDLHPSNRSRAEGELSDFDQQEAEERLKEMEAAMAGEDDCHLAKIKRGEAEAPIGGQRDE